MAGLIIGRDAELASLRGFLSAAHDGPAALLLEGEAGIGKTTLWEAGLAEAGDRYGRVLSARPAEAERELSFTGLGDLLGDSLDAALPGLPAPQRRALGVALLLEPGGAQPPEQRAVAAGFLGALRALARDDPLLVAIDDLQWLDRPSATALGFALRRLHGEAIVFLLAQRFEPGIVPAAGLDRPPPGLRVERMAVAPLSLAALQRLLHLRAGRVFTRPTLRRIQHTSGGNPFFALELARALGDRSPRPGEPLPVPQELRLLLRRRLQGLPPDCADLLLAVALLGQPNLALLKAASGTDPQPHLAAAVDAGVVRVEDGRVRFVHPLLASVVVEGAGEGHRRAWHRRLAELLQESESRARHLALGAAGPDEAVAEQVARAAHGVALRGAPDAAAELAEQARRLTPTMRTQELVGRAIDAAWYAWLAGDGLRAAALLRRAVATAPRGPVKARALNRLARVENHVGNRRAVPELCRAALAEAGTDLRLGAEIHAVLAWGLLQMREDLPSAAHSARTAVELAERLDDHHLLGDGLTAQAQSEFLLGGGQPSAAMERALALDREQVRVMRDPRMHSALLLLCADRLDEARALYSEVLERALSQGDESAVPFVRMRMSQVELLAGDWELALSHAVCGQDDALETGQRITAGSLACTRALVAAHLGRVDEARALAEEGLAGAEEAGDGIGGGMARWALGLLELSLGNAAEAERVLEQLWRANRAAGIVEPGENRFLGDLVEALVELRRLDEARERTAELERRGRELRRPAVQAVAARCRGLLAAAGGDLAGALGELQQGLALHAEATLPSDRARTLLALGTVERRARSRREARDTLGEARAVFADLGARLWRVRAEDELGRIGGRAPSAGALTPSEQRVAELVAQGRTNREVATALVVTERTVESHLSHVYRKLGVRSRAELAHRYGSSERPSKVP
jgi:DNA-binding CsgD family transcriptional regulator